MHFVWVLIQLEMFRFSNPPQENICNSNNRSCRRWSFDKCARIWEEISKYLIWTFWKQIYLINEETTVSQKHHVINIFIYSTRALWVVVEEGGVCVSHIFIFIGLFWNGSQALILYLCRPTLYEQKQILLFIFFQVAHVYGMDIIKEKKL